MALPESRPEDVAMDSIMKRPCIGDRVRINGFLGVFEIVQIRQEGLMVDLKHLCVPGPDYIEREVLSKELIYLKPPQPLIPVNLSAIQPMDGSGRASALSVPHRSASQAGHAVQIPPRPASGAPSPASRQSGLGSALRDSLAVAGRARRLEG